MASYSSSTREFEQLEDQNRVLMQKLSALERDVKWKDEQLSKVNSRQKELSEELREWKTRQKELQQQFEEAASNEQTAKVLAEEAKRSMETFKQSSHEQSTSLKSFMLDLQRELKSQSHRLQEVEEKKESLTMELRHKEQIVLELKSENAKIERESSSRLANLNQALLQAKKNISQVEIALDEVKQKEIEHLAKIDTLQKKCSDLTTKASTPVPCSTCKQQLADKEKLESHSTCSPQPQEIKTLPGLSQIDKLAEENVKLRQQYDCLLANFEMVSQKNLQAKNEAKESEKLLEKLQLSFDAQLVQKENIERQYVQTRQELEKYKCSGLVAYEKQSQLSTEIDTLTQQFQALQNKCFQLEEKCTTSCNELKQQKANFTNLKMQVSSLKMEKSASESEHAAVVAQLELLQSKSEDLKGHSSDQPKNNQQMSELMELYKERLEQAKVDNEELQNKLDDLETELCSTQEKLTKTQRSRQELKKKNSQLELQLVDSKKASLQDSKENKSYREENESLCRKLIDLTEVNDNLNNEIAMLQMTNEQKKIQLQEATKSLAKAQREVKHSWDITKKLQKELELQETQLIDATEQIEMAKEQCSLKVMELSHVKKDLEDISSIKTALETQVNQFIKKIDELETANFELDSCLAELRNETLSSKISRQDSVSRIEDLNLKLAVQENVLLEKESQLADARVSCELLEKENNSLLTQLDILSESIAASTAKVEEQQHIINSHEQETNEIATLITNLEESHLQCQPEKDKLKAKVDSLKEELVELKEKCFANDSSTATTKAEINQLRGNNVTLEAMNDELQEKLLESQATIGTLKDQVKEGEDRVYQVETELKLLSLSLESTQKEVQDAAAGSAKLEIEAKEFANGLELRIQQLEVSNTELVTEKHQFLSQIHEMEVELKELKHTNSSLEDDRKSLAVDSHQNTEKIGELWHQLDQSQRQLKEVQQDLKFSERKLLDTEAKYADLETRHANLEADFEHLKKQALTVLVDTSSSAIATPRGILRKSKPVIPLEEQENLQPNQ